MTKPRLFLWVTSLRLKLIELGLVRFYAKKFNKEENDIIRGMFLKVVKSDDGFDFKDFKKYVDEKLMATLEDDETRAVMEEQVEEYLKETG